MDCAIPGNSRVFWRGSTDRTVPSRARTRPGPPQTLWQCHHRGLGLLLLLLAGNSGISWDESGNLGISSWDLFVPELSPLSRWDLGSWNCPRVGLAPLLSRSRGWECSSSSPELLGAVPIQGLGDLGDLWGPGRL